MKDGLGLWYSLCHEYVPSTKQRSLSLAQALSSFPSFNNKFTLLENILQYEQLVSSYETSSGSVYPAGLKTATLIRCTPAKVRDHIQLKDDNAYSDVREALLSFDRVTRGFSAESIIKQFTSETTSSDRRDDGGVRDMEVRTRTRAVFLLEMRGEPLDVDVVLEKGNRKVKTSPRAKESINRREKIRQDRRERTTVVVVAGTVMIPTIMQRIVRSLVDESIKWKLMVVGRMNLTVVSGQQQSQHQEHASASNGQVNQVDHETSQNLVSMFEWFPMVVTFCLWTRDDC